MNHHAETPEQRAKRKEANKIRKMSDNELLELRKAAADCNIKSERIKFPAKEQLSAAEFLTYLENISGTGNGIGGKTVQKLKEIYQMKEGCEN